MIQVTNVVKRYGPNTVLNRATFSIAEAQLTTILALGLRQVDHAAVPQPARGLRRGHD